MPGAAPKAAAASHITNAIAARNRTLFEIALFIVVSLIAAFLVAGIPERIAARDAIAEGELGHKPTEVCGVAGIEDHVQRLAAAQRDGVGVEFGVHPRLVA